MDENKDCDIKNNENKICYKNDITDTENVKKGKNIESLVNNVINIVDEESLLIINK